MATLDDILARDQFGIKVGLDNMRALCGALEHPEHASPTVIIAGTNGKGSVAALVSAALSAAGHRTGRYTSPHLVRLEERFAIDGVPATRDAVETAATRVLAAERACQDDGRLRFPATFFELTTAVAFEVFRNAQVDIAVLEVGLGGRLDATNVAAPLVGAITSIDLDHVQYLGPTLERIAFEKAGVISEGMDVIVGPMTAGARATIGRVGADRRARVTDAFSEVVTEMTSDRGRIHLRLATPEADYGVVALALRGRHQVDNAVVAVRVLEALGRRGLPMSAMAIRAGLETAVWPGRLQEVSLADGRTLLVDGAHNPAGARALAAHVAEAHGRLPLVFGAMQDKAIASMMAELAPVASRVVLTEVPVARAADVAHLTEAAAAALPGVDVVVEADPLSAVRVALSDASCAAVAGSLFLAGHVLGTHPDRRPDWGLG